MCESVGPVNFRPLDISNDPPRDTWFHGTRGSWGRGDWVVPRSESGRCGPNRAPLVPGGEPHVAAADRVYVTRRFGLAWAYAHMSACEGDPVVLLVNTLGDVEPDPEHTELMYAFTCDRARVSEVDYSVPISAESAETGWRLPVTDYNTLPIRVVDRNRLAEE